MARFSGNIEPLDLSIFHEGAVARGEFQGTYEDYIRLEKLATLCVGFNEAVNVGQGDKAREAHMGYLTAEQARLLQEGMEVSGECDLVFGKNFPAHGSCFVTSIDS